MTAPGGRGPATAPAEGAIAGRGPGAAERRRRDRGAETKTRPGQGVGGLAGGTHWELAGLAEGTQTCRRREKEEEETKGAGVAL